MMRDVRDKDPGGLFLLIVVVLIVTMVTLIVGHVRSEGPEGEVVSCGCSTGL